MARIAKKSGAYHHGDLRRVLLETAVKVIDTEGVSALSLQALARRAGVSSGAPYHHFESRAFLLKNCLQTAPDVARAVVGDDGNTNSSVWHKFWRSDVSKTRGGRLQLHPDPLVPKICA